MPGSEPPAWGSDPLSRFLSDADFNARVTAARYPTVFAYLGRLHSAFVQTQDSVEFDSDWVRSVPRFLLIRAHAAVLAAIRAGMSGQVPEAFPVLRAAIEQSWYGLHIAKDPNPDRRSAIWLGRNDDEASTGRCKSEFTIKNVRSTHEALDPSSAADMQHLYEMVIEYGAHPNQRGLFSSFTATQTANGLVCNVGLLFPTERLVMMTLRLAAAVGVGALRTFGLIYPERFVLSGMDREIAGLIQELNSLFQKFGTDKG